MAFFSRKIENAEPLMDNTVYLIDTENVRTVWTLLLDRMTENDKIYVFYTMNSGNVSYEDLNGVISSGKNVELIQCHTGKNGLDFQLVSYLGYLIKSNENADYCIISDDSGYDAVIRFWEGRDVDVTRKTAAQVSGKPIKAPKKSFFGAKKPRSVKPAAYGSSKTAPNSSSRQSAPVQKPVNNPVKPFVQAETSPLSDKNNENAANNANVSNAPNNEPKPAKEERIVRPSDPSITKLKELLPDEPEDRLIQIYDIVKKSGGRKGLADIHDEIEKLYRNEKASDVYRIVRHNINDIYV